MASPISGRQKLISTRYEREGDDTMSKSWDWEMIGIIAGAVMLVIGVAATVVLIYP